VRTERGSFSIARPFRRMAEIASRGVVLRRELPAHLGGKPLYVSPECSLRYWGRELAAVDPILWRMADHYVRPGDVVWDVGANLGLFGFAAAHRASRVLLLEPDPWLANLLRKSAAHYSNVSVIETAVADYCGTGTLHIATRGRASNFLFGNGNSQAGGKRRAEQVRVASLDSLPGPLPNIVKIDVEGSELAVLRGATQILAKARPIVICEVSGQCKSVTKLLAGYTLFSGEGGTPIATASWNTVAIPQERIQQVTA